MGVDQDGDAAFGGSRIASKLDPTLISEQNQPYQGNHILRLFRYLTFSDGRKS